MHSSPAIEVESILLLHTTISDSVYDKLTEISLGKLLNTVVLSDMLDENQTEKNKLEKRRAHKAPIFVGSLEKYDA